VCDRRRRGDRRSAGPAAPVAGRIAAVASALAGVAPGCPRPRVQRVAELPLHRRSPASRPQPANPALLELAQAPRLPGGFRRAWNTTWRFPPSPTATRVSNPVRPRAWPACPTAARCACSVTWKREAAAWKALLAAGFQPVKPAWLVTARPRPEGVYGLESEAHWTTSSVWSPRPCAPPAGTSTARRISATGCWSQRLARGHSRCRRRGAGRLVRSVPGRRGGRPPARSGAHAPRRLPPGRRAGSIRSRSTHSRRRPGDGPA
jgi:hypothetical protein